MKYFVKGEFVEPGPTFSLQQFGQMLENIIFPSFEAVIKLEKEKKIMAAGVLTGARAGIFIVDVESNEELTRLLHGLPFWGLLKWEVVPLDSFEDRLQLERQYLEKLKK